MAETEETQSKIWHQWYWRRFLENLLLFLMIFFAVTPMLTYLIALGIFQTDTATAFTYTMLHAFCAFVILAFDVARTISKIAGTHYLFGFWFDSPSEWWLRGVAITEYKPLQLPKGNPSPVKLETVQKAELELERFTPYYCVFEGHEKPEQIILIPKIKKGNRWEEISFEKAFRQHRETVPERYPIQGRVTYGVFTLLLEMEYEGRPIPIYELTYSSGLVEYKQSNYSWFSPSEEDVKKAFLQFDRIEGTKWKLKYDNLQAFTQELIKQIQDLRDYGHIVADEIIKTYERTFKPQLGKPLIGGLISWIKEHKLFVMLIVGAVLVFLTVYFMVLPIFNAPPSELVPAPTGG